MTRPLLYSLSPELAALFLARLFRYMGNTITDHIVHIQLHKDLSDDCRARSGDDDPRRRNLPESLELRDLEFRRDIDRVEFLCRYQQLYLQASPLRAAAGP